MLPLLQLRDELDVQDDRHLRDFRRMRGTVQLFRDRPVHGPYVQSAREQWLRRVLEAQSWVRQNGPAHVRDLELISLQEMHEIRRIWVVEKHEFEDSLPRIYEEATGQPFPGGSINDNVAFGADELHLLKQICGDDHLHFELTRELLDIERSYRTMARRAGLYDTLEQALRRGFYINEDDAVSRARKRRDTLEAVQKIDRESTLF